MLLNEVHRFSCMHISSHVMLMRHIQLMMLNGKSVLAGNVEPTHQKTQVFYNSQWADHYSRADDKGQGSNPGVDPRSPALQADSLPAEPQGKPKNTEVGSLSLLQGIFLTQELNQGFLHCKRILDQLSYQGNPKFP